MRYYSPILCRLLSFQLISFLSFQATLSFSSSATQLCSHDQKVALIQFKTHFSIDKTASENCVSSYPKTNSWKEGIDCCLWDGVSCDNITGQVISLDLSCSWLSGTFLSNSNFFLLSNLQRLDLSFNDFKGSKISSKFGHFPSLTHLNLSNSWFSGPIPYEVSYLSKLVSLHLSYRPAIDLLGIQEFEPILKLEKSTLNGIVRNLTEVREIFLDGIDMSSIDPNSFMNLSYSLTSLSLASCHLRGKFPESSFKLPNIKYLILGQNPSLTGQFPRSNWSSPLEVLDVSATSFSGELPESFGNLKSLQGLDLLGCNFSGSIPRSLGNLSQLGFLYLAYNNLRGNIPSSLANLTQLGILEACCNRLEGPIPNNPHAFPKLWFLDLSDNLLSGITPPWLYTHPSLIYLILGNNQFIDCTNEFRNSSLRRMFFRNSSFHGSIPSSISKRVNLTILDLSSDSLNDTVSSDLSNHRILGQISKFAGKDNEFLDLHSNFIRGDLPKLPPNIRFLSISNNKLTGDISGICNAKSLEILDLSHNNFHGIIPQCIGNFSQNLSSLNLKMNNFHGNIPSTFAKGCGLKNLNLNGNNLEGPLTKSISSCKDLEVLDLGNNKINDSFPRWIEALSQLHVLILRSNKFQGPVGASKSPNSLPKLRIIDLAYNNFSGPLPTSYIENFRGMMNNDDDGKAVSYMGDRNYFSYDYSTEIVIKKLKIELVKILSILRSIDLSKNSFEGEIPRIIGDLSSLRGLNLSHNKLIGHIPPSLRNLTLLEWLDLSSNKLGGQIPTGLLDLTFLSSFSVSDNRLVGPIPLGKQFNTFGIDSSYGNEGLCGVPLSRSCSSNEAQLPPAAPWMNSDRGDGSKLDFGWKAVAIGYGFGFIFGVAMGCASLRSGKPRWFVTLFEARRQ